MAQLDMKARSIGVTTFATAAAILREFVSDVEAVGRKQVRSEWPDLFITFQKAEKLLIDLGTGAVLICPNCKVPFSQHKPCGSFAASQEVR